MHPEIEENMKEKLRLLIEELISAVDQKIRLMMAEHSAQGMLKSGNTIKRAMDYISEENKNLYKESINYLNNYPKTYHPDLELKVIKLVRAAHETYKKEVLIYFQNSTIVAGNSSLYQRMLPQIEANMATDLAKFQNELNLLSAKLMHTYKANHLKSAMWKIEGVLLLATVFIAGMWYKDPSGNYEPIIVVIGVLASLIPLCTNLYTNSKL